MQGQKTDSENPSERNGISSRMSNRHVHISEGAPLLEPKRYRPDDAVGLDVKHTADGHHHL